MSFPERFAVAKPCQISAEFRARAPQAGRLSRTSALLAVALVTLAACGGGSSNEEDRRFANDPGEERPTATAAPTLEPEETEEAPQASPESLLRSRGAPSTVYALIDGAIVAIDSTAPSAQPVSISPPENGVFVAIDSSLSGDRVVAATTTGSDVSLVMFDAAGNPVADWPNVIGASSGDEAATPDASVAPEFDDIFVQWGAQGDQILVGDQESLATVAVGGEVSSIQGVDSGAALRLAQWSPRGDRIALLLETDSIVQLSLLDPATGDTTDVVSSAEGPMLEGFAWLPDGSGMSFQTTSPGASQVMVWDLDTQQRRIIATAGQAGPSARIGDYTISPDGGSIAYVITLPDEQGSRFHSLWVRSLTDSLVYRLPVADTTNVNALWWTRGGLLWGQLDLSSDVAIERFIQGASDGSISTLLELPLPGVMVADEAATPDATPIGESGVQSG